MREGKAYGPERLEICIDIVLLSTYQTTSLMTMTCETPLTYHPTCSSSPFLQRNFQHQGAGLAESGG